MINFQRIKAGLAVVCTAALLILIIRSAFGQTPGELRLLPSMLPGDTASASFRLGEAIGKLADGDGGSAYASFDAAIRRRNELSPERLSAAFAGRGYSRILFYSKEIQASKPFSEKQKIHIFRDLEAATDLNPKTDLAYAGYGLFYALTDDLRKSVIYLSRAVEISPNNDGYLAALGLAYIGLDEYKKSVDVYAKAVALKPADPDYNYQYAFSLARGDTRDYPKAREYADIALRLQPESDRARGLRAMISIRMGDIETAESDCKFLERKGAGIAKAVRQYINASKSK